MAGFGGRVGLLALGSGVAAGTTTHTAYDHMSLLRTVEDAVGIAEHLNNAASSTAMTDIFAPAATVAEVPLAPLAPLAGALAMAWYARRVLRGRAIIGGHASSEDRGTRRS